MSPREGGQPLPGCSLRARIWENNALFETNAVTGAAAPLDDVEYL